MIGQPTPAQNADIRTPAFYQQASALKPIGKLGQVLKRERVATSIAGAEAWRIAYVSSDTLARRTVVTGLLIAPKGPAPRGGRPIVSWAHGTTGTAENCGPSQLIDPAKSLNQYHLIGGDSWTDYGVPSIDAFIRQGYVVVATDYQGLGGGGAHQYAVSTTQARDAIDAIRAAGSTGLAGGNRRAMLYGWSQGGGAVLAAAGSADYLKTTGTAYDGIEVAGFVALAPQNVAAMAPSDASSESDKVFSALLAPFTDDVGNFAHLTMTLWANAKTFPELKLTDVLTDDGAKAIDAILSAKCIHPASDTIAYVYGDSFKSLLRSQPVNSAAWVKALTEESGPLSKTAGPVIIFWGTKDTVNPPVMGKLYRQKVCAQGGNVARVQLPGEQTHFSTPGAAEPLYLPWIKDRLDGKPAADGCAASDNGGAS